jgi:hypothetical protein
MSLLTGIKVVVFLIALAVTAFGAKQLRAANRTRRWRATHGVVNSTRIETFEGSDTPQYRFVIAYDYLVDTRTYEGSQTFLGSTAMAFPHREQAEKLQRRYPPTARVPVYYDPVDPRRAVLERGIHWSIWLLLLVGLVFLAGLGWDLVSGSGS